MTIILTLIILILILLMLGVLFVSVMLQPLTTNAAYVNTTVSTGRELLKELNLKPGETFVDLGSGDGRLLRSAAKEYGVMAIGYEIALLPLVSYYIKNHLFLSQNPSLHNAIAVFRKSAFDADISQADVIFLYMSTRFNTDIQEKLLNETKPTARIVSLAFPFTVFREIKHGTIHAKDYWIYGHHH